MSSRRFAALAAASLAAGWALACDGVHPVTIGASGDSGPDALGVVDASPATADAPPPSLAHIEATIFAKACSFEACHGGSRPQEGMRLDGRTHRILVGQPSAQVPSRMRVVPGDPEASYLFEKITRDPPTEGDRMPADFPLSAARIELIRRWIAAGAPDN